MADNDNQQTGGTVQDQRTLGTAESGAPNREPQNWRRRDMLKVLGTVPAALVPIASPAARAGASTPKTAISVEQAAAAPAAYQPKVLDAHEWKTIHVLSDLIIPADDRSGSATQAGVPEFIDDWLDFKGGAIEAVIRGGLTWLDTECSQKFGRDFVDCTEAQQKQILDRIAYPDRAEAEDLAGVAFFNKLRDLVVSGFFSSEMGVKDLPYLGNQMLSEWNGCPPNVLAKLGLK